VAVVADQIKLMEPVFLLLLLVVVEFIFTQAAVVVQVQVSDFLLFLRYILVVVAAELVVSTGDLIHLVEQEHQEFYML
jgi:hypothetical protein